MSITFPKPNLLGPKVPGVIVIGLMVAQYILFGSGSNPEPKCTLNVERPHYSTYLNEYKNLDAVKLNIRSTCNYPQEYTELNSQIETIINHEQLTIYKFGLNRAVPHENPNVVVFSNLFTRCQKAKSAIYSGTAFGKVRLKNGVLLDVSGKSDKFTRVYCQIIAK